MQWILFNEYSAHKIYYNIRTTIRFPLLSTFLCVARRTIFKCMRMRFCPYLKTCRYPSERWRRRVPPKRPLPFNGLLTLCPKKTVLFKTAAMGTSNPTQAYLAPNRVLWLIRSTETSNFTILVTKSFIP
jgi:hypothetical protein